MLFSVHYIFLLCISPKDNGSSALLIARTDVTWIISFQVGIGNN